MKILKNVDLLDCMERILDECTVNYKTDFLYDAATLSKGYWWNQPHNFIWLARKNGSEMYDERSLFITQEKELSVLKSWCDSKYEHPRLFSVFVDDIKDGKPLGDIILLDIEEYLQYVKGHQWAANRVLVWFEDETRHSFSCDDYAKNKDTLKSKYGRAISVSYAEQAEMPCFMKSLHNERCRSAEETNIDDLVQDIRRKFFAAYDYPHNDLVRMSFYDAKKSAEIDITTYLLHPGGNPPIMAITSGNDLDRLLPFDVEFAIAENDVPYFKAVSQTQTASLFSKSEADILLYSVVHAMHRGAIENNPASSFLLDKIERLFQPDISREDAAQYFADGWEAEEEGMEP